MTLEKTHERIAMYINYCNGYNRNACDMAQGENMRNFRESDLKLQHASDNMAQHLNVP